MSLTKTYQIELFSFDELDKKSKNVARKDIKMDNNVVVAYRKQVSINTFIILNEFQNKFLTSGETQGIIVDNKTGVAKISLWDLMNSQLLKFIGMSGSGANLVFWNFREHDKITREATDNFEKQVIEKVCPQLKGKVSHDFALAAIKELDKVNKFRFRANGHIFKEDE